jgi:predicted secreted protein
MAPVMPTGSGNRVALLSHCLANQNAKVDEYALCPGMVSPVVAILKEFGYAIQQMPCPEMAFLGVNRWWQVKEQYDTPGFRRHCRALAHSVADLLEARVAKGCRDLVLIGVDGSGSSAVTFTGIGPAWGGRPEDMSWEVAPGKGVWIEELEQILAERALPRPREFGVAMELPGFTMEKAMEEFRRFLAAGPRGVSDAQQ